MPRRAVRGVHQRPPMSRARPASTAFGREGSQGLVYPLTAHLPLPSWGTAPFGGRRQPKAWRSDWSVQRSPSASRGRRVRMENGLGGSGLRCSCRCQSRVGAAAFDPEVDAAAVTSRRSERPTNRQEPSLHTEETRYATRLVLTDGRSAREQHAAPPAAVRDLRPPAIRRAS